MTNLLESIDPARVCRVLTEAGDALVEHGGDSQDCADTVAAIRSLLYDLRDPPTRGLQVDGDQFETLFDWAKRHAYTRAHARQLCREGKVPGAEKPVGGHWRIRIGSGASTSKGISGRYGAGRPRSSAIGRGRERFPAWLTRG